MLLVVDTNGGNSTSDHLHGKIPHKPDVMSTVLSCLIGESYE